MKNFLTRWFPLIAVIALVILILTLGGCTFQSSLIMKCKGECELEVERGIDTKAPDPVPGVFKQ